MGNRNTRSHFLLTFGSLIGLLLGFLLGAIGHESSHFLFASLGSALQPIGEFWTNSLRMIILPLMCSYLFLSVAAEKDSSKTGRIATLTLACFGALLTLAIVYSLLLVPPIFERLTIDASTHLALANFAETSSNTEAARSPGLNSWISQLMPPNLIDAAAKDQFISIITATLLFALAVRRIPNNLRSQIVGLARAVSEATAVLVGWLLKLMPLGVFALIFVIAYQSGFSFAGALGYYVLAKSALVAAFVSVVYFFSVAIGRIPIARFSWGILPAQLVAVSTRSSLASLPSLMDCAEDRLKLEPEVSGLVLPLSVSAFKLDVAITSFVGLFFLTNLHTIDLATNQLVLFTGGVLLFCFSAPGIPTGGFPHTTPLFLAMGIPIESAILLSAVGVLPDVFQTLLNVTADISVACVVNRFFKKEV